MSEDATLHSHRRENLKSYMFYKYVRTRITGDGREKLLVQQDVDDWAIAEAVIKEHYATKIH
jgi:hypothetical protein